MFITNNHQSLSITNLSDVVFLRLLLVFSIFIGLLTYGYEITNFSLSIDEEVQSFNAGNWQEWVSQGRWGMGILVYIFPHRLAIIPFLPTILFALGLSLSAVKFSTVFASSREGAIGFIAVFVSSPIWLHIGEFNTLSWGFSIGLIITAIATQYVNQGGIRNSLLSGVCIGFSLAVYQALFILYLTAVLLICIKREWDSRKPNTEFLRRNIPIFIDVLTSVIIALGIYYSMNNFFLYISGSKITYLNNFINLSAYKDGNAQATIIRVLNYAKGLLLGTDPTFLGNGITSLLLFWFGALLIIKSLFDSGITVITKLYAIALSIGILLLAISLILLSAGYIPTRALIVFPFLYALLSAVTFNYKKYHKLLWLILSITLVTNIYIANSLFYADHLARQRDLVLATRLIDRIEDVGRSAFGEKIPLVIVGQWQHELGGPALHVEIFGDSFFEHDGGNPYRIAAYLRLLGCRGLAPLPIIKIKDELQDIKLHPSWPVKEAVFLTKDALIVKLSEPSYQQGLALLAK
jgi:Glucosyl transferase GtrII